MKCIYCGYPESKVVDSRATDESNSIRRRRECLKCGKRYTTYETVETTPLVLAKKDQFQSNKLKIFAKMLKITSKTNSLAKSSQAKLAKLLWTNSVKLMKLLMFVLRQFIANLPMLNTLKSSSTTCRIVL